ncbi:MAG TPA: PAS domain S-box protein [Gemmatimonadaceae bacterium]|nr:PAS domain S-box protein [Gemmatimonadaceae bacterium]
MALTSDEAEDGRYREPLAGFDIGAVLEHSPNGVAILDAEYRCRYLNAEGERVAGVARDQVIGRHAWEVMPHLSEDAVTSTLARVASERREATIDVQHPESGRWYELRLMPAAPGVIVYSWDVTEHRTSEESVRRSEQRFRSLIENASDTIAVIDAHGILRYVSPAHEQVLGLGPEELVGHAAGERLHPDDYESVRAALSQASAHPGAAVPLEFRYRHRDGSWRRLAAIATNLLDDASVGGVVVNSHDITERATLEEQFRQAQKMEPMGRLMGGIAHDFNNLLAAMMVNCEFLREELGSPSAAGYAEAEEISRAVERAAALTRQLLAFSRKETRAPGVLDLNRVVLDTDRMLRRVIGVDITLTTELDPSAGAVRADGGQLTQVLMNLAVNARDAMPSGGRLTLRTWKADIGGPRSGEGPGIPPGAYVALEVRDNGCGMDEATRARAFEPFFTTKGEKEGTGLGLPMVQGIVQESHGFIEVASEPGRGAAFTLYFPRVSP